MKKTWRNWSWSAGRGVLPWVLGVGSVVGSVVLFARGRRKLGVLFGLGGPAILWRRLRAAT